MKQIRENIYQVTFSELGTPVAKGYVKLPSGRGEVLLDEADMQYAAEYRDKGWEPSFFISRSPALNGAYTVVSRQRA